MTPHSSASSETPIRGGIFHTVKETNAVVRRLLKSGMTKDQITVVCSDPQKERPFHEFEHQEPAGRRTPRYATLFGLTGALLGGLTVMSIVAATGDRSIFFNLGLFTAAGVIFGAIIGAFIGAMMTRGFDKELANFYDQGVEEGEILVAAEDHSKAADSKLKEAQQIIAESGSKPVKLGEG